MSFPHAGVAGRAGEGRWRAPNREAGASPDRLGRHRPARTLDQGGRMRRRAAAASQHVDSSDTSPAGRFERLVSYLARGLGLPVRLGDAALFCVDNAAALDLLRGRIDAIVSDPPYGIAYVPGSGGGHKFGGVAIHGDDRPFDPRPLLDLAPLICLWGANHYASRLPDSPAWLVWDKRVGRGRNHQADGELAWTNARRPARVKNLFWSGAARTGERGEHWHPTQKSVSIMAWCLNELGVGRGRIVCDPYMGSGSTGLACLRTGRYFVGLELERRWFDAACARLRRWADQADMFGPAGDDEAEDEA